MTNEERRVALAMSRRKALDYAEASEDVGSPAMIDLYIARSLMWSGVAQAMKVGGAIETDGADGYSDGFQGEITR